LSGDSQSRLTKAVISCRPSEVRNAASCANDGTATITLTFEVGDPPLVNQGGITITKRNPNFVLIVNLFAGQVARPAAPRRVDVGLSPTPTRGHNG
jgi:hypothetical protein